MEFSTQDVFIREHRRVIGLCTGAILHRYTMVDGTDVSPGSFAFVKLLVPLPF